MYQVEYGPDGIAARLIFVGPRAQPEAEPQGRPKCQQCGADMLAGQIGWVCSMGCLGRPIGRGCPKKEIHHPPGWLGRFGAACKELRK